jgi:Zn-dependent metalloprotease
MKRKIVMKIAVGLILALIIALPSYSAGIKAMHENQPVSGRAITSDCQGQVITKPTVGLQNLRIRGLKMPVTGIVAETASGVVKALINTGSLDSIRGLSPYEINGLDNKGTNVTAKRTMADKMGNKHIRMSQKYQGLTVVGAEIIVHIDKQNRIFQINGKYLPAPSLSVIPAIEAETALQIGLDEQQGKPELRVSSDPVLVIYGGRLAYFYVIEHKGPDVGQWRYYVDAQTGDLLFRYNNIQSLPPTESGGSYQTISGNRLAGEDGTSVTMQGWLDSITQTGNYFLYNFNDNWGIYDVDVGDWEQQASITWGTADRAAVSAGNNFETVQDYVSTELSMNSFNNAGAFARANVHEGTNEVNAWWDGTDFHFGDGDGSTADPLTVLDIVAHEYGHALTQYWSNLIYAFESGALNESYSDIVGFAVEFYAQPDGRSSYPGSSPGDSDWLMGEDCWLGPEALRNMRDPMSYSDPSYYYGTYWYHGSLDNGGVHTNSSPLNFAFYLLAEGGTGTNDGTPYDITGIGIEDAAEVAINANRFYHTSSDQYSDARQAWISAATALGYNVATVEAVFDAIGVGNSWHQPGRYPPNATDFYADQDFVDPANDSFDIYIADDFVCADPWVIQEIFVPGGFFGGGTTFMNAVSLHFEIYANNAGVPDGDPGGGGNPPIWSLSVPPTDSQITINNGSIDLPTDITLNPDTLISLSAGTYWLVFYPEMEFTVGGQYGRRTSDTTNGYHAQVINPGGGFIPAATTWTPVTDGTTWALAQQDFAFRIDMIIDPGTLQFSSAAYSVGENGGTADITVTRASGNLGAVSIAYTTSDGTASDGTDYTLSSGTLTWNNGDATDKTISVPITDDTDEESNETVNLTLSNPQGGATLGTPGAAVLTITDNDSTVAPPPAGGGGGGGGGGCFISTAAFGL